MPESAAIFFGVGTLVGIIIVTVGVSLFSVFWFSYLRFIVGIEKTNEVESQVSKHLNIKVLKPIYTKIKKLFYGFLQGEVQ